MTELGHQQPNNSGGEQPTRFRVNVEFIKSTPGIFKIAQAILSLITFICATSSSVFVAYHGGGWVQFVGMIAFIITLIQIIMYLFDLIQRLPDKIPFILLELIYYVVIASFFFIALLVSAVKAKSHPGVGAAAFFSVAALVLYAADALFTYLSWRRGGGSMGSVGAPASKPDRSTTTDSIGTTDITPGVYSGGDLRHPDPSYM